MEKSESILKIAPAFLSAQKELEAVKKEAINPFFKSKYADLPAVIEACKSVLNKFKIAILQPIADGFVETVLLHESGEWLSSKTKIVMKSETDPQAQGSAISYARRYGLQSMVLLSAEDDDGETAMGRPTTSFRASSQEELMKQFKMDTKQVPPKCPNCGSTMLLVKRKDGSGIFWSCPNWKTKSCQGHNVDDVDINGNITMNKKSVKKTATTKSVVGKDEAVNPSDIPF